MNQEILNRIQKLLNLTVANGATVGEAANAAKAAQKLMLEHQLTATDLSDDKVSRKEAIHNNVFLYEGQRVVQWKSHLANVICKVNGCYMFINHVTYNKLRYAVVGRDSDIEVCKYFYNYLSNEIERLCKTAMACGYGTGKTWSNSFKWGATKAIVQKLEDAQKEVRAENVGSTALVKVDAKYEEVTLWAKQNIEGLHDSKRSSSYLFKKDAYTYGHEAGSKVSLNKGIGASSKTTGLLK